MARPLFKDSTKSGLTLFLALAAFLMGLYTISDNLIVFFKLQEWKVADWLVFAQLLVFFASAIIAYTTISSSRTTARERATLDTILDDNKDETLGISKTIVLKFNENPERYYNQASASEIKASHLKETDFGENGETVTEIDVVEVTQKVEDVKPQDQRMTLALLLSVKEGDLTKEEAKVRMHLLKVLNRYEFYAIGINQKLLDEEMFKRMYCSTMLKFWAICSPAVSQLRETAKKDTIFKEFELLVTRWKANPLKIEDIK
ncbi:DUF4760 domain-containing protein [Acinetobacter baumannii]|uniref:DUF4760 domain-containing protein n=1 Tax=Acinetobacter baumannii TaxID=470 RepID=UPI000F7368CA|nr:DUF4760 domain-containing protein [Acinetobacter baumannii]MDC4632981.1 DUF4760 domain-containing protein [Acinetobacter baumannii]MDC5257374.1 DUF4760 domain-containing protein [Acinetobacter baumannii]MDK2170011.1 DUF4760 domain-containing protein [Acinetobacter baumannii]MDK2180832.1 DUF4760 domain-containing protein [Acinetobacter baumannii]MDK2326102.1 DUF4760 domain-containing protein [Acinetobacter baumannii]